MGEIPLGETKLASAMIASAFRDMRATHMTQRICPVHEHLSFRVKAAVWLVSKDASVWFDVLGADQRTVLERARWGDTARKLWGEILHASPTKLETSGIHPKHIRLLRSGLLALKYPVAA